MQIVARPSDPPPSTVKTSGVFPTRDELLRLINEEMKPLGHQDQRRRSLAFLYSEVHSGRPIETCCQCGGPNTPERVRRFRMCCASCDGKHKKR